MQNQRVGQPRRSEYHDAFNSFKPDKNCPPIFLPNLPYYQSEWTGIGTEICFMPKIITGIQ